MASEIKMPQLGLTMTEGTVTRWFKQVGDAVAEGEVLFEVATDKITNQIESTAAGTLLEIRVPEGQTVPVQAVVGFVGAPGESVATAAAPAAAPVPAPAAPQPAAAAPATQTVATAAPVPAATTGPAADEIKMPQLGLTMTEGTVTRWFKKAGEPVAHGEVLFEVATDKITNQIESTAAGTLLQILVEEGQVAPVQAVLAYVGEPGAATGSAAAAPAAASAVVPTTAAPAATPAATAGVPAQKDGDGWVKASPAARKLAKEMNVDLAKVTATGPDGRVVEADVLGFGWVKASPAARKAAKDRGIDLAAVNPTGPDGRVVERDVLAYAENKPAAVKVSPLAAKMAPDLGVDLAAIDKEGRIMKADVLAAAKPAAPAAAPAAAAAPAPAKAAAKTKPLVGMRKVIAERMQQSWNAAPHVHLTVEVDMTNALALKDQLAKASGQKASVTEIIIKCAAQVLMEIPVVNASVVGNQIVYHDSAAVGVAVSLDDGLIVPVIREVEKKSIREIRSAVVDLGARARAGKLLPDEISGGTFTVTNLGMFGTDHFTPVINPPESAILAVCRTVDKPVVVGGQIVIRPMCNCVLAFDHRLVDGAVGAKYMARFRELMENPLLLLIG